MMDNWTTDEFLSHLRLLNAEISVHEGQLKINAPKGALTEPIVNELKRRKPDLIQFLTELKKSNGIVRPEENKAALRLPQITPVSRDDRLPLSFAQERLWFLDQMEPESVAYNMPGSVRFRGRLDKNALKLSFTELSQRHEALRTSFRFVDDRPILIISSKPNLLIETVDLRNLPRDKREAEARRLVDAESHKPFKLDTGPLFRVSLYQLDDEDHLMHMNMHHIISDYWSFRIICREIGEFYKAFCTQTEPNLAELPVQYADFSHCQRQWLQGKVLDAYLAYWKEKLSGDLAPLELPTDRQRPDVQTHRGGECSLTLKKPLIDRLKKISSQEGTSLFMLLLAAFKVLLFRHAGQEDIIVGTPIAGRNRIELEGLIGFFINTIVMRSDLSGKPTFRELLKSVRETALGAYSYQEMPFEKLVEVLAPERDLSRTPLFQVFFNYFRATSNVMQLPGVEAEIGREFERESKFDITLYAVVMGDTILLRALYNADLFDDERIKIMLDQYHSVLKQINANPDEKIGQYSLSLPSKDQLIPDPTASIVPRWPSPVHRQFTLQSQNYPENTAVIDQYGTWTYRELETISNQICNYLRSKNIHTGETVAVLSHRSAGLVLALLGIMKAGASFLILDAGYPASRLSLMMKAARPVGWLELEAAGVNSEAFKKMTDDFDFKAEIKIPKTPDGIRDILAGISSEPANIETHTNDIAYIVFTSGTTGQPKGVLTQHGPLSHFIEWQCQEFQLHRSDRFSFLSGLSHDPLMRDIFTPLSLGATLCIPKTDDLFSSRGLNAYLRDQKITVVHMTPALGQILADSIRQEQDVTDSNQSISDLRYIFFGGDALTWNLVKQLRKISPKAGYINFFGTTETPQAMGYYRINGDNDLPEHAGRRAVPLGQGIRGVQLLILNEEGRQAGVGELGEIHIRTPYLAKGYLNDDELTQKKFITNHFSEREDDRLYKTGDLGRYLPEGGVMFHGRSDDQVSIRGFRVELKEIEAVLAEHPDISKCAVVARNKASIGTYILAFFVSRNHQQISETLVKDHLKRYLPEYMIPARIFSLQEIPLTPNGKIDRKRLGLMEQALIEKGRKETDDPVSTSMSEMEKTIVNIWIEVLDQDHIGIHDNFFELGGHSLLTIQAIEKIEEKIGLRINPREFVNQSVGQLAASIEKQLQENHVNEKAAARSGFFKNIRSRLFGAKQLG